MVLFLLGGQATSHSIIQTTGRFKSHKTDMLAIEDLTARGVTISHPTSDQGWGLLASMKLPSGSELSIYQPRHPTAYDLES